VTDHFDTQHPIGYAIATERTFATKSPVRRFEFGLGVAEQ